ncbi:flavin reductase family protein [Mucilaginibacter sp. AW1-3]
MHISSQPSILYFGTPVVLVGTKNSNGTDNLAPISSVFWLGWRCVIGISGFSKTTENILRTGECVLNLPSINEVTAVNRLAKTTGTNPVPIGKQLKGYRYEQDKFAVAGLTRQDAETIDAPRVKECPVQLEAVVEAVHSLAENDADQRGKIMTIELRIQKVHLHQSILMDGHANRVDPDKWRPLIMSFQEFYGLGEKVHSSTLAEIPEQLYNGPDRDRAIKQAELNEAVLN